ncbi:MAG: hypothetical protein R3C32_13110 [Chloroflexota bacterium]
MVPALCVSNHVVDPRHQYPRDQLQVAHGVHPRPAGLRLPALHAEVGSDNPQGFVSDGVVDSFCVLGEADEHIASSASSRRREWMKFNIYAMNGDEEAQLEAYGRDIIPALTGAW